ncbi:MAG TPA: CHRD domain-containing protein [Blastocatellia bacterium]|nr:CHRD domain-containing protein [Blastocatellia bacterium]
MRKASSFVSITMLAFLTIGGAFAAQKEDPGGRPLSITLTGAAEVPGPGDADGTGTASITLNQGQGKICFELTVSNIAEATAAHIHEAPADKAGPPVVTLAPPPSSGSSKDCVTADAELIKRIRQNPQNFYINVHNAEFPDGAVRGQLSK